MTITLMAAASSATKMHNIVAQNNEQNMKNYGADEDENNADELIGLLMLILCTFLKKLLVGNMILFLLVVFPL